MDHFAGLDVSVKETSVCILDDTGRIVREVKVASEPEALLSVLKNPAYRFKRIGLEAGPSKAIAIENDLRGSLRNFGLKMGLVGTVKFEARIKELVENLPDLAELVEPMLVVRRVLREQFVILNRRLLAIVQDDAVCRRLMTTPGVGPVVALTYRATVDVPARLRKSKAVGAVFGLTCSKYQSGEIDWSGRISRCGDEMMRVMLYEAAQSMLAFEKMVLAQGLGDADRQAPWEEKSDRGPGASVGRDHAPHLG